MPYLNIRNSVKHSNFLYYLKFYKALEMIYCKLKFSLYLLFLLIFPQKFELKNEVFVSGPEKMFQIEKFSK